jgi:hypothetical protein
VLFLRIVAILIGLGVAGSAMAWLVTRERKWLTRAWRLLWVGVVTGLVFFGVLLLERLAG